MGKVRFTILVIVTGIALLLALPKAQITIPPQSSVNSSGAFSGTLTGPTSTCTTPTYSFIGAINYGLNLAGTTLQFCVSGSAAGSFVNSTFSAGTYSTNGTSGSYYVSGRAGWQSPADKQITFTDVTGATGVELNVGTPTLGTCTGGTLVSGSHNAIGRVTGTTGGTCAINFGTPNFVNAPFCLAIDETAGGIVNTSGEATNTFTISNITSGHNVKYFCFGRIGT